LKRIFLLTVIPSIIIVLLFGLYILETNSNVSSDETLIFDLDMILKNMDDLTPIPFDFSSLRDYGSQLTLDQKIYTWTDKVYITIVAPAHNFDVDMLDEIGNSNMSKITIFTSNHMLDNYKLVETGSDTGIFSGELILTGFEYDADGNKESGLSGIDTVPLTEPLFNGGNTDGLLEANANDSITVVFMTSEYSVIADSKIRWNVGEIQWLEAQYLVNDIGIVRVIDPDMNLYPEKIDSFKIIVSSESNETIIPINVIETNEATGIFEGEVNFTLFGESNDETLRISQGPVVTAKYVDYTLPNPHNLGDKLEIIATSQIVIPKSTS